MPQSKNNSIATAIEELFAPSVSVEKSHISTEHLRAYVIPEPHEKPSINLNDAFDKHHVEVFAEHRSFGRDVIEALKVRNYVSKLEK